MRLLRKFRPPVQKWTTTVEGACLRQAQCRKRMHTLIISVALAMSHVQAWMGMGMESGERTCEVRGSLGVYCNIIATRTTNGSGHGRRSP